MESLAEQALGFKVRVRNRVNSFSVALVIMARFKSRARFGPQSGQAHLLQPSLAIWITLSIRPFTDHFPQNLLRLFLLKTREEDISWPTPLEDSFIRGSGRTGAKTPIPPSPSIRNLPYAPF